MLWSAMKTALLAITAAFLSSAGTADTLIANVDGIQVDAQSRLQLFSGILFGDDGKVVRLIRSGEPMPKAATVIDEHGRTVMPGFIESHGHVTALGFAALTLAVDGTRSLGEMQP